MSFYEIRFPLSIGYGASGGPAWSTSVVGTVSGAEQRNQPWANPLGKWDVPLPARMRADMNDLIALFHVAQGRTHGFRFRDEKDYRHSDNGGSGVVALISGNNYQMYKRYTVSGQSRDRKIQKPVSGTIAVQGGGTYSTDYATGIITRTAGAVPTGWTGEFDVPVRLDVDQSDITAVSRSGTQLILGWSSVPLQEIRV
jgi:uncharacterized protein (TIGR02217 family)